MAGAADRGRHGHKFIGKTREVFLEELAKTGHIYHACKVAGVSYQTMKLHREGGKRYDPEFEADYQQAMGDYVGTLKAEAQRRAIDGWDERPVIDKTGQVVGQVRKYSDMLLLALLKRSDDGYRERVQVDARTEHEHHHVHEHGVQLEKMYKDMTSEEQDAWKTVLRALARSTVQEESDPADAVPPREEQH